MYICRVCIYRVEYLEGVVGRRRIRTGNDHDLKPVRALSHTDVEERPHAALVERRVQTTACSYDVLCLRPHLAMSARPGRHNPVREARKADNHRDEPCEAEWPVVVDADKLLADM